MTTKEKHNSSVYTKTMDTASENRNASESDVPPDSSQEQNLQPIQKKQRKSRYAFVIAFCCFLMMFVNVGMVATAFNVYQPYIVKLPGVGDTGGSIVISFRMLVSALAIVFVVGYYHMIDLRAGISLSIFFASIGFFLFGFAQGLPGLLLASVFTGMGYGLGGVVAMTYAINRWFANDVATVVGVTATGSGLAAIVMAPLVTFVAENVSLSWAFWTEAAISAVFAAVSFVLLRNRPSDMGCKAYHFLDKKDLRHKAGQGLQKKHPQMGLAPGVHLSRNAQLALAGCSFCVGTVCISAESYIAIHMTTNGFSPEFVGTTLAIGGLCISVSKIVSGRMYDKFGARWGTSMLYTTIIVGLVCALLIPTGNTLVAVLCVVCLYYGGALNSVGLPVWGIALSNAETREKLIKDVQVFYSIGGLAFNFIPGFLVGIFGSYEISYALFLGMSVAAMIVVDVLLKRYLEASDEVRMTRRHRFQHAH